MTLQCASRAHIRAREPTDIIFRFQAPIKPKGTIVVVGTTPLMCPHGSFVHVEQLLHEWWVRVVAAIRYNMCEITMNARPWMPRLSCVVVPFTMINDQLLTCRWYFLSWQIPNRPLIHLTRSAFNILQKIRVSLIIKEVSQHQKKQYSYTCFPNVSKCHDTAMVCRRAALTRDRFDLRFSLWQLVPSHPKTSLCNLTRWMLCVWAWSPDGRHRRKSSCA